ncbi:MAG: phosphotransferase [Anaeroplasmataceae bacterium]|nr:phosphotransferase [Anaeroplasmataceae bacterium]MDE6414618.1 phosphotransferase [Anaeroplasmataceae bacterium]
MKRFGLLGEHLSHSYSKIIHTSIFKSLNIEATYSLLECKEEELKNYIELLKQGKYSGFNVTIPYKKTIIKYLDCIDEKAKAIGSVNTVYVKNGKVYGTNTDYDGFLETLKQYQIDVLNKECYILGTGGASLAVNKVLADFGGRCHFVSRTPKNEEIGYKDLETKKIDVLINTTPVGMYPNVGFSPVSKEIALKAGCVIDIIFNPLETQLLKDADSNINGLHMLVMQAIKAEEIWQGRMIEDTSIIFEDLKFILGLPLNMVKVVQNLNFKKDTLGCSQDEVYIFEDQFVVKISSSKDQLLREKERIDWLADKIPGPKSIMLEEHNSKFYYLRTCVNGDNLISKRFLNNPFLLIETIKKVVDILRSLDSYSCPFKSMESIGNSFIHGDLCLPNIYVNEKNEFAGFIDLDNAGLGDAWEDYAWLIWSFEYNLKTNKYTKDLLHELGLEMNMEKYKQYVGNVEK